ncbi:MAG: dihydroorotase, partial [Pseudomonadota bacterium]
MTAMMIHNVRLLDPASELDGLGWLLVENGRITKLALGKPGHHELADDNVQERIDGGGFCLAPGLVDMRVQPRSREVDAADREIGLQAASGGITSVVCVPSPAV